VGEILDRSFAVYRANFWLFVGIGSLSAVVQLITGAIQLVIFHGMVPNPQQMQTLRFGHQILGRQIGGGIAGLLVFLVSAVTQAATVWALSEVYLGRRTTIGISIRAVIGRWLRFLGIGLWQGWSAVWLMLVLAGPGFFLVARTRFRSPWIGGTLLFLGFTGGLVYGVIAFLRNSLGVQAAVLEHLKVRAAMRRSKVLAAGAKGRMFVVYLIAWCLFMVAGILQMPLAFIVGFGAMRGEQHVLAEAAMLLVNFIAHSMVVPVLMIGLSVVYFDQRVRQDGLDLLLMLSGGAGSPAENSLPTSVQTTEPAGDAAGL
jgi:hypothetical protein